MPTINQLCKKKRKRKKSKIKTPALRMCPQKKGICLKVFSRTPKKPNSAIRKVARVILSTHKIILIGIGGHGHKLQEHSTVLIRGGKLKDVPGIHYKAIRGKYDFLMYETFQRRNRRSKYGRKHDV